jgi:hypothetical protein
MKDGRSVVVVVAAAVDKSSGTHCRAGSQRDGAVAGSNPVQQATSQSIIHNSVAIKEPTLSLTMELESKLPWFAFCNRGVYMNNVSGRWVGSSVASICSAWRYASVSNLLQLKYMYLQDRRNFPIVALSGVTSLQL